MTIYIPWGLIAIAIAFYYFYAYNRSHRLRKEEQREELNNRRQELLERTIMAKKNSDVKENNDSK